MIGQNNCYSRVNIRPHSMLRTSFETAHNTQRAAAVVTSIFSRLPEERIGTSVEQEHQHACVNWYCILGYDGVANVVVKTSADVCLLLWSGTGIASS